MSLLGFLIGLAIFGWFALMTWIAFKALATAWRYSRFNRAERRHYAEVEHQRRLEMTERELRMYAGSRN